MKGLLISCLLFGVLALSGKVIEPFSSPEKIRFHQKEHAPYKTGRGVEPATGKTMSFFELNSTSGPSIQFYMGELRWLGNFRSGVLRVRLISSVPGLVSRCFLRMVDKPGEVFQYQQTKRYMDGVAEVFEFRVEEKAAQNSWGTNVNKKFDLPIAFSGLAIRVNPKFDSGRIWLECVELLPSQGTDYRITRPLLTAPFQQYMVKCRSYLGKSSLTARNDCLKLDGNARTVHLTIDDLRTQTFENIRAIRFRLFSSVPGKIGVSAIDASKQKIPVAAGAFQTGESVVELRFPENLRNPATLQFLAVDFGKTPDTFELRGAELITAGSEAQALTLRLEGDNPFRIQEPGRERELVLHLKNSSDRPLKLNLKLNMENYYGTVIGRSFPLALAPGEEKRLHPVENLPAQGVWYMNYEVAAAKDSSRQTGVFHFANMPVGKPTAMRPNGEFLFGMNGHLALWNDYNFDLAVRALVAANVKLLRASVWWDVIQPEPDRYDWNYSDRLIHALQKNGIASNWNLYPMPKWSVPKEAQSKGYWIYSRTAPEPGIYEKFAETLAARYKGKIRYYEIWNEADLVKTVTLEEYLRVLKEGFRGVRRSDPEALVTTTGFASLVHPAATKDFQRNVLAQGKGFYDIHALHEHGGFSGFASVIDSMILPMREKLGVSAPWYANETAVTSAGGQDRMQAETVFKKILFAFARGSSGYIWYNLRSKGRDPLDAEHCYGLMTYDFHPKYGYGVFSALAGLYAGTKFDADLKPLPGQFCFRFRDDKRILLAAWNEAQYLGTVPTVIRTDAAKAYFVDLFGNRTPLPLRNGVVIFPIGTDPGSLELPGATKADCDAPLLAADAPSAVAPGQTRPLAFRLFNPFDKPVNASLSIRPPAEITCGQQKFVCRIPAGKSVECKTLLAVSPDFRVRQGSLPVAFVDYEFEYAGKGRIRLPLNIAFRIPSGKFSGRAPDFVLDKISQVFNRYQADPANQHRLWRGPADLSAKIWLGREPGAMLMRVEVEDDIHCQPEKGPLTFTGDNIQLSLVSVGEFEISLSHLADGSSEVFPTVLPSGFERDRVARQIQLKTERIGTKTIYDVRFPYEAVGLSDRLLENGFRFNLIINENDGAGRNGWLFLSEGLGRQKNTRKFPCIVFQAERKSFSGQ